MQQGKRRCVQLAVLPWDALDARSGARGSSDDGRTRQIIVRASPSATARILAAQADGATDDQLHPLVAQALAESYFQGSADVKFEDVDSIDFSFNTS